MLSNFELPDARYRTVLELQHNYGEDDVTTDSERTYSYRVLITII